MTNWLSTNAAHLVDSMGAGLACWGVNLGAGSGGIG